MKSAAELLRDAKQAKPRETLLQHRETIATLREKNYTWREIAQFFTDRGIDTDHSKIFRLMQREGKAQMNSYENFFVPSAEKYAKAFSELNINESQKKMLEFHYGAHNRTVTYTELAKAAGSTSHVTANRQYGKLGRALGEKLSVNFVGSEERGKPFFSSALGSDNPYKSDKSEYQLVMHHEVAKAIEQLGWFSQ